MLVRLVRYLNFWCHFVSELAGDFRQSSRRQSPAPATNDSPGIILENCALMFETWDKASVSRFQEQ